MSFSSSSLNGQVDVPSAAKVEGKQKSFSAEAVKSAELVPSTIILEDSGPYSQSSHEVMSTGRDFSGVSVPQTIQCESTILRPKDHPTSKNFGERGVYLTETVLHWGSIGAPHRKEPKVDLSKAVGIKIFIEDGLKSRSFCTLAFLSELMRVM